MTLWLGFVYHGSSYCLALPLREVAVFSPGIDRLRFSSLVDIPYAATAFPMTCRWKYTRIRVHGAENFSLFPYKQNSLSFRQAIADLDEFRGCGSLRQPVIHMNVNTFVRGDMFHTDESITVLIGGRADVLVMVFVVRHYLFEHKSGRAASRWLLGCKNRWNRELRHQHRYQ